MPNIFLATLGQRPEAITIALDTLKERYPVDQVVIIHSNPTLSGISKAYSALRTVLEQDYSQLKLAWREVRLADGRPMADIDDEYSGESYFRGVYEVLIEYREQGVLHLLVAGGRKVMSIYGTLAAALVFRGRDFLWSVHSPPELVDQQGQFHVPYLLRDQVHLVRLPLRPIRTWRDGPPVDLDAFFQRQWDTRSDFLSRLTEQERAVTLAVESHPLASNKEIGALFSKSDRTVENQLSAVYGKLIAFLDIPIAPHHKRKVLLELLRGEL